MSGQAWEEAAWMVEGLFSEDSTRQRESLLWLVSNPDVLETLWVDQDHTDRWVVGKERTAFLRLQQLTVSTELRVRIPAVYAWQLGNTWNQIRNGRMHRPYVSVVDRTRVLSIIAFRMHVELKWFGTWAIWWRARTIVSALVDRLLPNKVRHVNPLLWP